jgi:hypothetical protein
MINVIKFFFCNFNINVQNLILFNKKNFNHKNFDKNIILFDYSEVKQNHIPYSYLANVLSSKYNARLVLFKADIALNFFKIIIFQLFFFFSAFPFSIYKSFGTSSNVLFIFNKKIRVRSLVLLKEILKKIKSKEDILEIKLNNIVIGDLIYDHYLKSYRLPTIDFLDKKFIKFLHKSILIFIFWEEYFKKNRVKAIHVGHGVYLTGVPCRIAISNNIPVYHGTLVGLYRLNHQNNQPNLDFKYLKKNFKKISKLEQKKLIKIAKHRINLRINKNAVGVDMGYSKKSAWVKRIYKKRVLINNNKIKILISAHCFFDSPHGYGQMVFPDFYEWIDFLGKISNLTDYDWYIKTHPDYLIENNNIINHFLNKYKKFTLIDSNTSHHQIISEGINFALTCHGTIGFEYAIMGVPVINASLNNPHINYDFNIHASNIIHYKKILLNLKKIKLNIKKNQVYEYYAMNFLNSKIDYIFDNNDKFLKKYNFEINSLPFDFYTDFINYWNKERHNKIIKNISNFINSSDYKMQKKHISI